MSTPWALTRLQPIFVRAGTRRLLSSSLGDPGFRYEVHWLVRPAPATGKPGSCCARGTRPDVSGGARSVRVLPHMGRKSLLIHGLVKPSLFVSAAGTAFVALYCVLLAQPSLMLVLSPKARSRGLRMPSCPWLGEVSLCQPYTRTGEAMDQGVLS
jgi:hypothetical protein